MKQKFKCPLPPGSVALCSRGSNAHCPTEVRRCAAELQLPTAVGAQLAVATGCSRAVGGCSTHPLRAAGPHGGSGPHTLGTEFVCHVIKGSIRVWYPRAKACATLLKARPGPNSRMAWVLQELRLHQHADRKGVPRELLG